MIILLKTFKISTAKKRLKRRRRKRILKYLFEKNRLSSTNLLENLFQNLADIASISE
jgi:hypothetical protein